MVSGRYLAIADQLASELVCCGAGTRVASENEIAQRFGVGRAASRSALQELERRLVVRRIQGAGTFVNRRIDYVISGGQPPSWHATVAAAGASPRAVVKTVERRQLPQSVADHLQRDPGEPVYRVVREFYIDDLLASWVTEWIPESGLPELGAALQVVDSLDTVLRQVGRVRPVRAWCRVGVDIPPPDVVAGLRMESCQPVWQIESVSRDRDTGVPLMFSRAWTRIDAVQVVVELDNAQSKEHQ